jgi:hypothetical protein
VNRGRALTMIAAAGLVWVGAACQPDDSAKSYRCRMAFVSNELVLVETCPNAEAGDTLSLVLDVSILDDREVDIWVDECLRSGGTLRVTPSAESLCFDVDF